MRLSMNPVAQLRIYQRGMLPFPYLSKDSVSVHNAVGNQATDLNVRSLMGFVPSASFFLSTSLVPSNL